MNMPFNLWFCGGLWFHVRQLYQLNCNLMGKEDLIFSPSIHGDAPDGDLAAHVDARAKEIEKSKKDAILFAHSYGIRSAIDIAQKTTFVKGIICFDPAPHKGIYVPLNYRFFNKKYILPILFNQRFSLEREDEKYVLDGADTVLGPESGKVMRDFIYPHLFGFRIKPLYKIDCRSTLIISTDNKLIPSYSMRLIEDYHSVLTVRCTKGGHFAHCNPEHAPRIASLIRETIESWGF